LKSKSRACNQAANYLDTSPLLQTLLAQSLLQISPLLVLLNYSFAYSHFSHYKRIGFEYGNKLSADEIYLTMFCQRESSMIATPAKPDKSTAP
jgi:hypothetical protein